MQNQLNNLFAARTQLQAAPKRVETLKGVIKKVEQQEEQAATKLASAKESLTAAQQTVETAERERWQRKYRSSCRYKFGWNKQCRSSRQSRCNRIFSQRFTLHLP